MTDAAALLLVAVVAGSVVYCVLGVIAAARYVAVRPPALRRPVPVSILKPLHGLDEGLEENLRGFFEQRYEAFEILFAVRTADDPATAVVQGLTREYPRVPSRLLVTGEPPYANAKVWSLERMTAEAAYDLLVMSDSDVRVTPEMLAVLAAEFEDERTGVSTCPYRAVPGASFWSRLEAIGMNTEFLAGVLTARMLEGMKFALGPTITARRAAIEACGGWRALSEFLAEDFVLGQRAAAAGWGVLLSSYVIEHRIGAAPWRANAAHRLRWHRSTRRSRPAGYIGQLFTFPLPAALLLVAVKPDWWAAAAAAVVLRAVLAWATAGWVLRDALTARRFYLLPLQDLLSFAFWLAGFFGNTITWRGRRYVVLTDGRFRPAP